MPAHDVRPGVLAASLPSPTAAFRPDADPRLVTPGLVACLARAAELAGRPGVVLPEHDLPYLRAEGWSRGSKAITKLRRDGRLQLVRRGAYVLVDPSAGRRARLGDVLEALTPGPFLISGGRALAFHGLTDRCHSRVDVVVNVRARDWNWNGDDVRYTCVEAPVDAAVGPGVGGRFAPPVRAIADCLSRPRWGVELADCIHALKVMLVRDPEFPSLLAGHVATTSNRALARRLGFLVSALAGEGAAEVLLRTRGASNASTLLQSGGPRYGPVDRRWRVRCNVDLEGLLAQCAYPPAPTRSKHA